MNTAGGLKTEILAVGTELLTPFFQDTNSLFLIERLGGLGISVSFKTIVGDDPADLGLCFRTALGRSRLIIAMGGLGPTEDDRTAEIAADVLGRKLVFNRKARMNILERFRKRGLPVSASNRKQAYVLDGAEVLANPNGTAPGQWVEHRGRILVLLPGPPHELKPMFETQVLPRLRARGNGFTVRRILRLTGTPESLMEDRIRRVYSMLPPGGGISTLASPGDIQIHLTISGDGDPSEAERRLDPAWEHLLRRLGENVYSTNGESLEQTLAEALTAGGKTVACAESCSGGFLSHRLTNVPGSSAYFRAGIVSYSNAAKESLLGVPASLIRKHGAVSGPVAKAMALGIRRRAGSDFGLAITGVAGPGGGTAAKPVGLVFTALAGKSGVSVEKNLFFGTRDIVKFQSSQKALDLLRRRLLAGGR